MAEVWYEIRDIGDGMWRLLLSVVQKRFYIFIDKMELGYVWCVRLESISTCEFKLKDIFIWIADTRWVWTAKFMFVT